MIDQRKLPIKLVYVKFDRYQDVAKAIKTLVVRGAPAIGVAAAFGLCLAAYQSKARDIAGLKADLKVAYKVLKSTRPTAVNLVWALDLILRKAMDGTSINQIRKDMLDYSVRIAEEDVITNRRIGRN